MAQTAVNNEANRYQRMCELISKDGKVWAWNTQDFGRSGAFLFMFDTVEDAQEYTTLKNQNRQEHGHEAIPFVIGSEADYCQAAQKWSEEKRANESKEYAANIDTKIARLEHEIKALEALKPVCRKFDGKVLNKRFHDAVKEATGYSNTFGSYDYDLKYYGREFEYQNSPSISLSADWSHGYNRYTGKPQEQKATDWKWGTGDRLEAEKAMTVIEPAIEQRQSRVASLQETKNQYAEYLQKAREAEKILKALSGYDCEIRQWAKDHDLTSYSQASHIWMG